MTVILFPVALLLIFVGLRILALRFDKPGELFIQAVLLFSALVVISTEILTLLHFYCYQGLTISWGVFDLILFLFIAWKFKHQEKEIFNFPLFQKIRNADRTVKTLWLLIILLLSGIFVQGLIYPPNNWDSMTYHMARIVHWVQNRGVEYYPTNIARQLYQSPFAEYFISQLCILSRNDLFANAVQWFFLVSTLFVIRGIARELGMDEKQQLIVVILTITIPEVVLQGSSTQNDIVVSFFISGALYYSIISLRHPSWYSFSLLGISIALAILTKATAFIFLAPVVLAFGAITVYQIFIRKKWWIGGGYILIITVFFILNGGFFYRNYQLNHNIFGMAAKEESLYKNTLHSLPMLISNVSRNGAMHFGVPGFSGFAESGTKKLHHWIGMAPNDPRTTFDYVDTFRIQPYGTHEDYGANIIHVVLMIVSTLIFLFYFRQIQKEVLIYFLIVLSQFLLFCFYLKWQPWNSRLHTPMFILFTPVLSYILAYAVSGKIKWIVISLLLCYAAGVFLFNYSRPIIPVKKYTAAISICDDRFKKYFSNRMNACNEFRQVVTRMENHRDRSIGLELQPDDWEYPFFTDIFSNPVKSFHLEIQNESRRILWPLQIPDCIISTKKHATLTFLKIKYYNFTPGNLIIFYYRPADSRINR